MSEGRVVIIALWLALAACVAMVATQHVRAVAEEDDCADGTLFVKRTPVGLVCVVESGQ